VPSSRQFVQIVLNNDILMEEIWEFMMVLFVLIREIEDCVIAPLQTLTIALDS